MSYNRLSSGASSMGAGTAKPGGYKVDPPWATDDRDKKQRGGKQSTYAQDNWSAAQRGVNPVSVGRGRGKSVNTYLHGGADRVAPGGTVTVKRSTTQPITSTTSNSTSYTGSYKGRDSVGIYNDKEWDYGTTKETYSRSSGGTRSSGAYGSNMDYYDESRVAPRAPLRSIHVSTWSADDTQEYRDGYPGKPDNRSINKNKEFYFNEIPCRPDGLKIEEILTKWKCDYDGLERRHGYIQWLFPIRERGVNMESQELQPHEAEAIKNNRTAYARVRRVYELMLDFYGLKLVDKKTGTIARGENWKSRFRHLNSSLHNYLRITRILKSLGELGYEHFKVQFVTLMLRESTEEGTLPNCRKSCHEYWINTLRNSDERDKLTKYAKRGYLEAKTTRDTLTNYDKPAYLEERSTRDTSTKYDKPAYLEEQTTRDTLTKHDKPGYLEEKTTHVIEETERAFWTFALCCFEFSGTSSKFEREMTAAARVGRHYLTSEQWRNILFIHREITGYESAVLLIRRHVEEKLMLQSKAKQEDLIKLLWNVMEHLHTKLAYRGQEVSTSPLFKLWQSVFDACPKSALDACPEVKQLASAMHKTAVTIDRRHELMDTTPDPKRY